MQRSVRSQHKRTSHDRCRPD